MRCRERQSSYLPLTELHVDNLCAAIDVDFISKLDGIPKLLERVDALLPPVPPNEGATLW
jgi:hypothetical protein